METVYISAQEAADILGKTRRRINQLVDAGKLTGKLIGNSNVIELESVLALKKPKKGKANGSHRAVSDSDGTQG